MADTTGAAAQAATTIAAGYAFAGPALELGSVVLGGQVTPDARIRIPLSMMNRHGLVAGATGTGKTKTLQGLAEQLSAAGVPVFLADMKGDLSGVAAPGTASDRITQRAKDTADDWAPTAYPAQFLAIGGKGNGLPLRATVTSFGPTLLAKVLELNDTQESSLELIFHYADKGGLALLDLKDLQAVIAYLVSDEGQGDLEGIGGLAKATAGVIQRELTGLADDGGDVFFGEPEYDVADLLSVQADGKGVISVVELAELSARPQLFSTFLMWLLAELHEHLPEVGDLDKPKLVFFLDEAHLLFNGASKAFLSAVTQTVRLIRSKGVGVFFCTQNPTDVPNDVLAQLGNRVQHALRAFTPDDATALNKAVKTYPKTADYDLATALTQLGIGEAIVVVMSETGAPTPVAWTRLRPPRSLMAQLDPVTQTAMVTGSPLAAKYADLVDRESAYELLAKRHAAEEEAEPEQPKQKAAPKEQKKKAQEHHKAAAGAGGLVAGVLGSSAFRSMARSAGSALGREITRGLFGTAKKRRR